LFARQSRRKYRPRRQFETVSHSTKPVRKISKSCPKGKKVSVVDHEVDYTVAGGQSFKSQIFYEYDTPPIVYGFSLAAVSYSRSTINVESAYAYNVSVALGAPTSQQYSAPVTNILVEGYFPVHVASNFKLIPKFGYSKALAYVYFLVRRMAIGSGRTPGTLKFARLAYRSKTSRWEMS
jgi:hypothetical protein